jgi:hypothetical protein
MLEKGKVYRSDAGSGASEYIFCETDGGLTAYGKGLSVTIMPSGEIVTIKPNRYFSVSEVMVQRDMPLNTVMRTSRRWMKGTWHEASGYILGQIEKRQDHRRRWP